MKTFIAVDDDLLARRIAAASDRVIFVAPAVSTAVAAALGVCFSKEDTVSITVVLDPDEEGYRLGYPRVGFIVTNLSRPAERVVAFYNKRGTCEQWIKGAIKWTRLSCRTFAANAVRLQLHALAYNLGNFLRTLATPEPIKDWSLTSLKEKLIKIGAKVVSHGRYVAFQMAEVAIPRQMFQEILRLIAELRPQPPPAPA